MTGGRTRRTVLAAVALVLLVGSGAAACAKEATELDRADTQRAVERVIGGRIGPDVDRVRCPEEIPRGAGKRIACAAVLADGHGEVRLRVRQVDDEGKLEVELLDAVIDRTEVAEDLRRTLVATYLREFSVDCGKATVEVVAPAATFDCTAEDATGTRVVEATVVDASGTLRYDVGED